MTAEDRDHKVSPDESQARQKRKKRKWDQPAEFLPAAGLPFPIIIGNSVPVETAPILPNLFVSNGVTTSQVLPLSGVMLQTAPALPKSNQPKAQEELIIAREIVINDADPAVRYKLTKRQTQEEIQRSTGAVVTTRGKYRPPNALPDGEKSLYLHISAGSHLKETVERILAVDRAAATIEDILKQGLNSQHGGSYLVTGDGVKASQALSLCVYLGFDINPAWNIASRIRGPNDQYINHMNETGASVSLRGRGSGTSGLDGEEGQQPLHLFLSATNPKSLENAKNLAEHLLDTISVEFGVSRTSSTKLYAAVPPPQPLVTGALTIGNDLRTSITPIGMPPVTLVPTPAALPISIPGPGVNFTPTLGAASSSGPLLSNGVQTLPSTLPYSQPSITGGTRYSGYEGIYPRATPLQQVALVLKHSTTASTSAIANTVTSSMSIPSASQSTAVNAGPEKDKRHAHRRKFQELPVVANEPSASYQDSQVLKPGKPEVESGGRSISGMLPPKKSGPVIHDTMPTLPPPKGMPPPPTKCMTFPSPKSMPSPPPPKSMPPPPPPKFTASEPTNEGIVKNRSPEKKVSEPIPDTLVKLMEYGEEDDDDIDEASEEPLVHDSNATMTPKPFWAV